VDKYAAPFFLLLSKHVAVYQELVSLGQEKTRILVTGDIKKLENLLTKETELLLAAGKLEKERHSLVQEWSTVASWEPKDVTIEFIITQIDNPDKAGIQEKALELKGLVSELSEANRTNAELIERALQFVNYSLELMVGGDISGMTYGANGHMGDRQSYKVVDHKA
jgi:flagellar biosynthesis/type III secretory pathway chaperone